MKPKAPTEHEDGLLEYLEDIIGTSKYKDPIDESLVEMERLQEDRQMKLNRLRHVEKEKTALEAKKKEAVDYLRMKNEHVRASSRLYQFYIFRSLNAEEKVIATLVNISFLGTGSVHKSDYNFSHRKNCRSSWTLNANRTREILRSLNSSDRILPNVKRITLYVKQPFPKAIQLNPDPGRQSCLCRIHEGSHEQ